MHFHLKGFSDFFFNVSIPELPVFCQFCWHSPFFVRTQSPAFQSHFVINQTNSLKLMSPLPSTSMTLTRSFNSSSVGDHPKVLITLIDISSKVCLKSNSWENITLWFCPCLVFGTFTFIFQTGTIHFLVFFR